MPNASRCHGVLPSIQSEPVGPDRNQDRQNREILKQALPGSTQHAGPRERWRRRTRRAPPLRQCRRLCLRALLLNLPAAAFAKRGLDAVKNRLAVARAAAPRREGPRVPRRSVDPDNRSRVGATARAPSRRAGPAPDTARNIRGLVPVSGSRNRGCAAGLPHHSLAAAQQAAPTRRHTERRGSGLVLLPAL